MVTYIGPNGLIGFPMGRVSNITPFTYRDGATMLEKVEEIVSYVNKMYTWVTETVTGIESLASAVAELQASSATKNELQEQVTALTKALDAVRLDLAEMIGEATQSGTVVDPTNGEVTPVNLALGRMYNHLRIFAPFVDDVDPLTVDERDALGYEVDHADLAPLYPTLNDVPKE